MRTNIPLATLALLILPGGLAAQLPDPGMEVDARNTALVITDPQNDFLSSDGVAWGVVSESVTENNTVENIERLLRSAKERGIQVFVSPHYYYPTDHGWQFGGALEVLMHNIGDGTSDRVRPGNAPVDGPPSRSARRGSRLVPCVLPHLGSPVPRGAEGFRYARAPADGDGPGA